MGSITPLQLYPQSKGPKYTLDMRFGGPQVQSGCCEEKKIFPKQGLELQPFGRPVSDQSLLQMSYSGTHTIVLMFRNILYLKNYKSKFSLAKITFLPMYFNMNTYCVPANLSAKSNICRCTVYFGLEVKIMRESTGRSV
jgi:hypothetical protein